MPATVHFANSAERHFSVIDQWWKENRPAAPDQFYDEVRSAVALLETAPEAGRHYARIDEAAVRRLVLPVTRYHLYYTYDVVRARVLVVSIWSSRRGVGPDLT